jgi:hypothetical protein
MSNHITDVARGVMAALERPRRPERHSAPFPFSVREYSLEPRTGELEEEEFE